MTETTITRAQILALRSEASAASDWAMYAICEEALGRHEAASKICDEEGTWRALERCGVLALGGQRHSATEARAQEICAKAIAAAAAQGD